MAAQTSSNAISGCPGQRLEEPLDRTKKRAEVQQSTALGLTPPSNGFAKRALLFTPSWFSITMGTGIISILLHELPYQFSGLRTISIIVWILNICLFALFLLLSAVRYTIWPRVFNLMLVHNTQAFFLGTFAMGFATIVNMTALVGVPAFGQGFATLAWVLWWIDAVLSLITAIGVSFVLFNYQKQDITSTNATWLLPVVAPIVASASGATVARFLPPDHARLTIITCYILWGAGFPIACLFLALYLHRISINHLPPAASIVSCFLPLGPCGQGAFALLTLSKVGRDLAFDHNLPLVSDGSLAHGQFMALAISAATIPIALVIWGFGLFWLFIAIGAVYKSTISEGLPFNMGWWAFLFPTGVFASATISLGQQLDSKAFLILGTIIAVLLVVLWLFIAGMTVQKAIRGPLFHAPCLGALGVL